VAERIERNARTYAIAHRVETPAPETDREDAPESPIGDRIDPQPYLFWRQSCHGPGKSALFAWIVDWLMSTRRKAQGTITANTNEQLELKTWWTALMKPYRVSLDR
jgi:hypothetical protein